MLDDIYATVVLVVAFGICDVMELRCAGRAFIRKATRRSRISGYEAVGRGNGGL